MQASSGSRGGRGRKYGGSRGGRGGKAGRGGGKKRGRRSQGDGGPPAKRGRSSKRSAADARGAWGYLIMTVPQSRHDAVREAQHLVGDEIESRLEARHSSEAAAAGSEPLSGKVVDAASSLCDTSGGGDGNLTAEGGEGGSDLLAELRGELEDMAGEKGGGGHGRPDRLARLRWLDTGARGIELLVSQRALDSLRPTEEATRTGRSGAAAAGAEAGLSPSGAPSATAQAPMQGTTSEAIESGGKEGAPSSSPSAVVEAASSTAETDAKAGGAASTDDGEAAAEAPPPPPISLQSHPELDPVDVMRAALGRVYDESEAGRGFGRSCQRIFPCRAIVRASQESIAEEVARQSVGLLDGSSRPSPFFLHVRVRNNNSKGMARQALARELAEGVVAQRHPILKAPGRVGVVWEGMSMRAGNQRWAEKARAAAAAQEEEGMAASGGGAGGAAAASSSEEAAEGSTGAVTAPGAAKGRLSVEDAKWAVVVEVVGASAFVAVAPAEDYTRMRGYAMPHTAMQRQLDRKNQAKSERDDKEQATARAHASVPGATYGSVADAVTRARAAKVEAPEAPTEPSAPSSSSSSSEPPAHSSSSSAAPGDDLGEAASGDASGSGATPPAASTATDEQGGLQ